MSVRRVPRAAPEPTLPEDDDGPTYCSNIECSRRMVGNLIAKHVGRCGACRNEDPASIMQDLLWDGTIASIDDYEGGLK